MRELFDLPSMGDPASGNDTGSQRPHTTIKERITMGTRMIIAGVLRPRRHREEEPSPGRHHADRMDAATRRTVRSLRAQHGKHAWRTTANGQHASEGRAA